ncbi:MAG: PAS domain S-box protein [Acidobacteria bacterium]|nr:PAS domain S-box protein [Acidobacteriota bacterium]
MAIVESSDDAILSKTLDGTILTWNAGAERMYGHLANEAIGKPIQLIVPPARHQEIEANMQTIRAGLRIAPYETTRVRKDGHELSVWVSISPILNRAGIVVGMSSIGRDITQRKQMEDQHRQTQKMEAMGSLAGGIAHDFNNLLTIIMGTAELAIARLGTTSPVRADIEEIRAAGDSAALLTRQLLTFTRKGIVEESIVDLNEIVKRLDKILRRTVGEDIEFVVRQEAALRSARADQSQMEQLLMNLVINARDAMPEGGALTVETDNVDLDASFVGAHLGATVGEFVKLSVADTGCGMTAEIRAQIFDPFFTTKGPVNGTGLGLSTVFDIVQQAGGCITVETAPGEGSTFTVNLPHALGEGVPPTTPNTVLPVTAGTETILLVEDDNNIRALSARGLRGHGYTVLVARQAGEAIKVADGYGGTIDLLLTDIVMPGGNGRALAERLVTSMTDLKVLYTSGYTDSIATLQAIRASSAAFIQKPYSPDALARKVRSVLDAAELAADYRHPGMHK